MIKQITTLLIFSLILSNMAWAASFEGLNCHDQNSRMEQTIDHEMAHSNNKEEHPTV